jgi:hypothetical protein
MTAAGKRKRESMETLAEGPETRERAARIGKAFIMVEAPFTKCPHCDAILFVRSGRCEACGKPVTAPPLAKKAYDAWPLKRLHIRGIVSDTQFEAGQRYYAHYYAAGLSSFGSVDLGRVGRSSSGPTYGMAATERQAYHRKMYRVGSQALGLQLSPYVDGIVLEEQDPELVGKRVTGRAHAQQARAVAIEMAKMGLDLLAKAYALK